LRYRVIWHFSNHKIAQSQNRKFLLTLAEETSPMYENKESLRFPIEEVEYHPDPDSLAGFIAGLSERVDELLAAANWPPSLE
jgi:hypothetical protein